MANFGVSLAIRLYLIGVLLGGWLDRRWAGGKGYLTILMVLITIVYSIYMLYRDLMNMEKQDENCK